MVNPYELVFYLYLNDIKMNTPLFKDKEEEYKNNFNDWIDNLFNKRNYNQGPITGRLPRLLNILFDISENESILFNCDNILEKLENNKEIAEHHLWKIGIIQKCFEEIESQTFDFKKMYNQIQAKKIYLGMKKFFDVYGHDPFLFANKELSDDDKMKFVHDIL